VIPRPELSLLRSLTQISKNFCVWKNADSVLAGRGDLDCAAPKNEWQSIVREFHLWNSENLGGSVFFCGHLPGVLIVLAQPKGETCFFELDLCARQGFRGSILFEAEDLAPLTRLDVRGFRRLRPGAEGLLLLFLNGLAPIGRPRAEVIRAKAIPELLREDFAGVEQASALFGRGARQARAAAAAVIEGQWNRRTIVTLEALAIGRALTRPAALASRASFRAAVRNPCPILSVVLRGRRQIPRDLKAWERRVSETHQSDSAQELVAMSE